MTPPEQLRMEQRTASCRAWGKIIGGIGAVASLGLYGLQSWFTPTGGETPPVFGDLEMGSIGVAAIGGLVAIIGGRRNYPPR